MEKSNFINIIVSIIVLFAGAFFIIVSWMKEFTTQEDILFAGIGCILILYAILRIILTNRNAHDIS